MQNLNIETNRNARFAFYSAVTEGTTVAGTYYGNNIVGTVTAKRMVGGSGSRAQFTVALDNDSKRLAIGSHVEERDTVTVVVDARDGFARDRNMGNAALDYARLDHMLTIVG